MELGLLISGNLGLAILKDLLSSKHTLSFVFTDSHSQEIIDTCTQLKISCFKGNPRNNTAREFLANVSTPELLLSVNYLFIIEQDIISKTKGFAINIHGSLLPKYRGRTPHVWAIINGEKETGITAHTIANGCDEGDTVYQEIIPIGENETGFDVLQKFNSRYPFIVKALISRIEKKEIELKPQEGNRATYFGKRTPEDGLINWDWQKEQIKNWIRAQAHPYPGAFTFYEGDKIIINKIDFSDHGYHYKDANGKILSTNDGLIIKTPNGAIKIIESISGKKNNFELGKIFTNGN